MTRKKEITTRDIIIRVLIHVPHGAAIGWLILWSEEPLSMLFANPPAHWCFVVVGVVLAVSFLTYEIVEDALGIRDKCFIDIFGYLGGMFVATFGPIVVAAIRVMT